MKLQVKIKTIGEERSGESSRTGDEWKGRCLLLSWQERRDDSSVLNNFLRVMAFGRQMEQVEREFKAGDDAMVDLSFSSTESKSGLFHNKVRIMDIQKISDNEAGKGVAV